MLVMLGSKFAKLDLDLLNSNIKENNETQTLLEGFLMFLEVWNVKRMDMIAISSDYEEEVHSRGW